MRRAGPRGGIRSVLPRRRGAFSASLHILAGDARALDYQWVPWGVLDEDAKRLQDALKRETVAAPAAHWAVRGTPAPSRHGLGHRLERPHTAGS